MSQFPLKLKCFHPELKNEDSNDLLKEMGTFASRMETRIISDAQCRFEIILLFLTGMESLTPFYM
ncbi:hypothetical protein I79_001619 [Cricetulus griseus]|uniref:Uncharacterized protein n=1 Tax=Cricetulus griseus TaxID=10029 RepID=G3GV88_CRIGR|nr:hypothetical protein I79_001619 [Cricetulus griseus]